MIDENGVYTCDYCQNEKRHGEYYTETGNHVYCTELARHEKIEQAVAELDKCDKAYVQALIEDASITKQIDDYDKAIENVLKVYRGEE